MEISIEWSINMLRHIVSISLAITACAVLMPTKANAVTLTVSPGGEIKKEINDSIEFIYSLNPAPSSVIKFLYIGWSFDGNELSESLNLVTTLPSGTPVTNIRDVASLRFRVINPVKDGNSDFFNATVFYEEGGVRKETSWVSGVDVVPVPEPLTIFGTVTVLGCGTLFKQKSFKKKKI
jgi:hypothetical protein